MPRMKTVDVLTYLELAQMLSDMSAPLFFKQSRSSNTSVEDMETFSNQYTHHSPPVRRHISTRLLHIKIKSCVSLLQTMPACKLLK